MATTRQICESIRQLTEELGGPPTQTEVASRLGLARSTLQPRLAFLANAGHIVLRPLQVLSSEDAPAYPLHGRSPVVSDEQVVEAIRDLTGSLVRPPSYSELADRLGYNPGSIVGRLAPLRDSGRVIVDGPRSMRVAGDPKPPEAEHIGKLPKASEEDVVAAIRDLTRKLGRCPSLNEVGEVLGYASDGARWTLDNLRKRGVIDWSGPWTLHVVEDGPPAKRPKKARKARHKTTSRKQRRQGGRRRNATRLLPEKPRTPSRPSATPAQSVEDYLANGGEVTRCKPVWEMTEDELQERWIRHENERRTSWGHEPLPEEQTA